MRELFCLGVLWIAYVYVGYPLILFLVGLLTPVLPDVSGENRPSVSVMIAARNEQTDIGWKITETLNWDYPHNLLEILVASDASEDSTDEVVKGLADPRVLFVRMDKRGGKVRALNRLKELAHGEILLFTDANAHIGARALQRMVRHFTDSRVGCVTGNTLSFDGSDSSAVSDGSGMYLGYETILTRLESRIGSVLVCDGAIFCIRATLYKRLSPDLANDLELPMRVAGAGYWIIHEPEALVFERGTSSPAEEFNRIRRMSAQGMLAMTRFPDAIHGVRGWQYVSHKFLRWLSLIPMLMMLGASALLAGGSPVFLLALVVQVMFYAIAVFGLVRAIAGRSIGRLTSVPFYVCLGVLGAVVGVAESLLGKRFDIWDIPALSRGSDETYREAGGD